MSWYPKRRFGDLADDIAARYPDREALVFETERYSFSEQAAKIDAAAKALMALGVQSGDHVAFWLNNSANFMFIGFALAKIGAVQVLINTRFRERDLAYVLKQSDAKMLITHDQCGPIDYLAITREVVSLPETGRQVQDPNFPELTQVVLVTAETYPGTQAWPTALAEGAAISDAALAERAEAVDPDDPVLIMYTSGTTGFPKGVVHSHKLIRNVEERAFRMNVTPNDVVLNYLPLFHAFGYSEGALMTLVTGAKHVITETFDPEECMDLIEKERVTLMHGFEAHLQGLTEAQLRQPRDIGSLRAGVFAAGMHSATPVARKGARILAPMRALSGYGMTEIWLGAGLSSLDDDEEHRCETSGYPGLGYELRIVDPDTGRDQPADTPGEILVRGFSLMLEYYKKPEETKASFTVDGWFKTGDTGILTPDGYLRFLGRYKDMLKVGGENVDPMEAEGILLEHPDIQQVAIVALPDERLSEIPVAYVQTTENTNLDEAAILSLCRGKLASFKLPRHVIFTDEFPMTASGKIRKVDLRKDAKERFGKA